MPVSMQRTATRWLLLCALFLGVVGMHHVATGSDMPSGHHTKSTTAHHSPAPEAPQPTHETSHLCVAVLGALVSVILLTWLLVRFAGPKPDRRRSASACPHAPDRPPPVGGRALLSSLCVLRL